MEQRTIDEVLMYHAQARAHGAYLVMSRIPERMNEEGYEQYARSTAEQDYRKAIEGLHEISGTCPDIKKHAAFLERLIKHLAFEQLQIRI